MTLQNCKKSRDELQSQLSDSPEDAEIHDNIGFYDANIDGLTEELNKLKGSMILIKKALQFYDIYAPLWKRRAYCFAPVGRYVGRSVCR